MRLEIEEYLTIPQAAAPLNIKPKTMRKWIAERKITAVHFGRAVRVPVSEVARLVKEGTIPRRAE